MQSFLIFSSFIATALAQTCASGGALGPCLNGGCPPGYTAVNKGTLCCRDSSVIPCADKTNPSTGTSDCPKMTSYCTNSAYKATMTEECPKTCGFCAPAKCADKVNPSTGRSDCPNMAAYCKDSRYLATMKDECPKTCGFCQ